LTAAVGSPGRKRKLDLLELEAKLLPLLGPAHGSVTNIRQQLAQQHQVQLSDTTLRRYLTRLGYRPRQAKSDEAPFQNSKSSPAEEWTKPWPRAHGESLADYLSKQARRGR
jgi:transposase